MRPCHHGWRCARGVRLGGVDGQMAVHSGPSKRTFEAMQPDWMLRLTSGFLQNSALTVPDTPAPPARAQDGRKDPKQKPIGSLPGGKYRNNPLFRFQPEFLHEPIRRSVPCEDGRRHLARGVPLTELEESFPTVPGRPRTDNPSTHGSPKGLTSPCRCAASR